LLNFFLGRALGVPVTDHTYEDSRLMKFAARMEMPAAEQLVEFNKANKGIKSVFRQLRVCVAFSSFFVDGALKVIASKP
jgi:hypothetical protein